MFDNFKMMAVVTIEGRALRKEVKDKLANDFLEYGVELIGYGKSYNKPRSLAHSIKKWGKRLWVMIWDADSDGMVHSRMFKRQCDLQLLLEALENEPNGDSWEIARRVHEDIVAAKPHRDRVVIFTTEDGRELSEELKEVAHSCAIERLNAKQVFFGSEYNNPSTLCECIKKWSDKIIVVAWDYEPDGRNHPRLLAGDEEIQPLYEELVKNKDGNSWEIVMRVNKRIRSGQMEERQRKG